MHLSHVEAFMSGFILATVLYFVISGLAWIRSMHGIDRQDALSFAERTNGKSMIEVSEIMREGHKQIEARSSAAKRGQDSGSTLILIAAEIERLSRELINYSLVAEGTTTKDARTN
jgi:hypothetical protein